MKISTVLFDLDGTLLPMDQEVFTKAYFGGLARKLAPYGYEKDALIAAIWQGSRAMVKNNGERLNEAVFWEAFVSCLGNKILNDSAILDDFYNNDFCHIKNVCGYDHKAFDCINTIKSKGFRVALATNPLFPSTATEQRIGWAGLSCSDFELVTTYENSHFCKPNLEYYKEIVKKLGVCPEECLMVGNDVSEDMIAENIGMKVFLLTNCLINKENRDVSRYPHGNLDDLLKFIDTL